MISKLKKPYVLIGIVAIIVAVSIIFFRPHKVNNTVVIVLSPHFDDAVLSVGGLLAKHEHPSVVATFFTGTPIVATSTVWDVKSGFKTSQDAMTARVKENKAALHGLADTVLDYGYLDNQYRNGTSSDPELEQEVAKDIQALLASYSDKKLMVYAPSIFNADITHPDHGLLHNAFVDVVKNYPASNTSVSFYFYEDFPYVARFNKEVPISLEKNLENDTGFIFDKTIVSLNSDEVQAKENGLKQYDSQIKAFTALQENVISDSTQFTQNRCGQGQACEVFYKIFRI